MWRMCRRINLVLISGIGLTSSLMWILMIHDQMTVRFPKTHFSYTDEIFKINVKQLSSHKMESPNNSLTSPIAYLGNSCKENTHVVYIRIPKTGSSTMTYVMWKFGIDRKLKFLLPRPEEHSISGFLEPRAFFLPNEGKFCDMMAAVSMYTRTNYQPYFPKDTAYITLLRQPMNQLVSTIYYYKHIHQKIPGNADKITNYLKNPERFEVPNFRSLTRNPMSIFMGLSASYSHGTETIQTFIAEMDHQLAFVLILERFDESLILMRKALCWPLQAIIYTKRHVNKKKPSVKISADDSIRLYNWSLADSMLYEHFNTKLDRMILKAGPSFPEELNHFRTILNETNRLCDSVTDLVTNDTITFPESRFSPAFKLTTDYCRFISTSGIRMDDILLNMHKKTNFCNG